MTQSWQCNDNTHYQQWTIICENHDQNISRSNQELSKFTDSAQPVIKNLTKTDRNTAAIYDSIDGWNWWLNRWRKLREHRGRKIWKRYIGICNTKCVGLWRRVWQGHADGWTGGCAGGRTVGGGAGRRTGAQVDERTDGRRNDKKNGQKQWPK